MCGITGVFHYASEREVSEPQLITMRDSMVHRGPDGGGVWMSRDRRVGLAHRRLSIIDLSTVASQPMANEDGSVMLAFNGEIYNHATLRPALVAAGHRFRTDHSDTEVLVHGFEEWGIDGLLERIHGDFALSYWDEKAETFTLVRDRMGVKPLYFALQSGTLYCASEVKALLAHPGLERDIDPHAMFHYLSFLATPAPMTMFKGIFKLPAGFYLQVKRGGTVRVKRYWDAVPGKGIEPTEISGLRESAVEDYYVKGIQSRLQRAVEKRMVSDVPFGVFLSGGIDSSTNVALMASMLDRPVDTFTVGFKDYQHLNELGYAAQVSKQFKTNHHEVLIDEQDMVGYLDSLIHHQDEPLADWVCIPLYFVSKLARDNGVTVVQVGEGSDEQFCGYASYMRYLEIYKNYWQPFRRYLPGAARDGLAAITRFASNYRPGLDRYADFVTRAARDQEVFWSGAMTFMEPAKSRLVPPSAEFPTAAVPPELIESGLLPSGYLERDTYNVIRSFLEPYDKAHPGQDVLARMTYNEFKLRLPELLLMRVDKVTMSVAVEARVPFLDHELVEFSMDIPMAWKTKQGVPKYILKKAVEGLIPHELIYREKMGFGAPMSQWLRGEFGLRVERTLMGSSLRKRGFFDYDFIGGLVRDHRSGRRDNSLFIWTLFNLTAWYDYWIAQQGTVTG
jgi:asparagine synthase (glutamine-hydrolysing)